MRRDVLPSKALTAVGNTLWTGPAVSCLDLVPVKRLELFTRPMAAAGPGFHKLGHQADPSLARLLDTSTSNNILIKFKDTTPQQLGQALAEMDSEKLSVSLFPPPLH